MYTLKVICPYSNITIGYTMYYLLSLLVHLHTEEHQIRGLQVQWGYQQIQIPKFQPSSNIFQQDHFPLQALCNFKYD